MLLKVSRLLSVSIFCSAAWLLPASAAGSGTLSIYPTDQSASTKPWYVFKLANNSSTHGTLTVTNRSNQEMAVLVYPVDANPVEHNGYAMSPLERANRDIGTWIQLDQKQIMLNPHSQKNITFSLHIPNNATVGPHYGGIVAQPVKPTVQKHSNTEVAVISRVGLRIYETVPGMQHPSLHIDSMKRVSKSKIEIGATNRGNTLLSPRGELTVRNKIFHTSHRISLSGANVLKPNEHFTYIASSKELASKIPLPFRLTASLRYGPSLAEDRDIFIWSTLSAFSLFILALAVCCVYLGIAIAVRYKKRKAIH